MKLLPACKTNELAEVSISSDTQKKRKPLDNGQTYGFIFALLALVCLLNFGISLSYLIYVGIQNVGPWSFDLPKSCQAECLSEIERLKNLYKINSRSICMRLSVKMRQISTTKVS